MAMDVVFEILNFFKKKRFDFDGDRTRVITIASLRRWPLGHPAQNFQNLILPNQKWGGRNILFI